MTTTRIKGTALKLEIDGEDYWADITSCKITNEDSESDTVTFEDALGAGERAWKLGLKAVQSTDPDSLWRHIWGNAGTIVPYVYAPHGNEVPTTAQPHFTGTVKIGPEPEIGGDAGKRNTYTFETTWDIQERPTLVTTSGQG
jgi:hypothetical protein